MRRISLLSVVYATYECRSEDLDIRGSLQICVSPDVRRTVWFATLSVTLLFYATSSLPTYEGQCLVHHMLVVAAVALPCTYMVWHV